MAGKKAHHILILDLESISQGCEELHNMALDLRDRRFEMINNFHCANQIYSNDGFIEKAALKLAKYILNRRIEKENEVYRKNISELGRAKQMLDEINKEDSFFYSKYLAPAVEKIPVLQDIYKSMLDRRIVED